MGQQKLFEFVDVRKGLSVLEAVRMDSLVGLENKTATRCLVRGFDAFFALLDLSVLGAPASGDVETLQCKAGGSSLA